MERALFVDGASAPRTITPMRHVTLITTGGTIEKTYDEQSGSLDTMLGKVADFYEEEVENAVKAMTQLIEPVLMVFLGAIIAVIMVAMYLPVFTMSDTINA